MADAQQRLAGAQGADIADAQAGLARATANEESLRSYKEMQALRSNVLRHERLARTGGESQTPNFPQARRLNEVSQAILRDMSPGSQSAEVERALNTSRILNERFSTGPVARIMGRLKTGGQAVDPALTLEKTLGKGVAESTTVGRLQQADSGINQEVEQFTSERFMRDVFTNDGQFKPASAQNFLKDHGSLLNQPEFASLRRNLETQTTELTAQTNQVTDLQRSRKAMEQSSVAAKFIGRNPRAAVDDVLRAKKPDQAVRSLMAQAKTPNARQGVRRAFAESFLQQTVGSGKTNNMQVVFDKLQLSSVLDRPQADRLRTVMAEVKKLDELVKAAPRGTVGVPGHPLEQLIGRVVGARLGAAIGGKTMAGRLQAAGVGSRMTAKAIGSIGKKDIMALLETAIIDDPKLLNQLLDKSGSVESAALLRQSLKSVLLTTPQRAQEQQEAR